MEQRRARWLSARRLTQWLASRNRETPPADPEAASVRSERARALAAALGQLSARQREVLHLVFSQDLTIEQAAGVLGIATGSARQHYERGKARLRELLSRKAAR